MERRVTYELLPEDGMTHSEPVTLSEPPVSNPEAPVEIATSMDTGATPEDKTHDMKLPELPSYDIATTLPSYEEAEQTKQTEEEHHQQINLPDEESQNVNSSDNPRKIGDIYLGTDGIFICSFLVAFLFNCLGLFAILCISQTIAARFGAVSGFGLSIVKYVAVMKYQNWVATTWTDGFSWLWWFMLFLGLLMFFRGSMQYIRIKHQWTRLSEQMRGRIYLYF